MAACVVTFGDIDALNSAALESYDRREPEDDVPLCSVIGCEDLAVEGDLCAFHAEESPFS